MVNTNLNLSYASSIAPDQIKNRSLLNEKNPKNYAESLEFLKALTPGQLKELKVQHKENIKYIEEKRNLYIAVSLFALAVFASLSLLLINPAGLAIGATLLAVIGLTVSLPAAGGALISIMAGLEAQFDLQQEKRRLEAVRIVSLKSDIKPEGFSYKNYLWKTYNLSAQRLADESLQSSHPRRLPKAIRQALVSSKT